MHRRLFLSASAVAALGLAGCDNLPGLKKPGGGTSTAAPGTFKGTVKAEWLTPKNPTDTFRDMKLLDTFGFVDSKGQHWDVPSGYVTNGASIPWGLWNIIGGPYDGPYRDAAVIHDYYCEKKLRTWEDTHSMYYQAALARGTSDSVASTMYAALRFGGPRWVLAGAPAASKKADLLSLIGTAHAQSAPAIPPPAPVTKVDPGLTNRGVPASEAAKKAFEELQAWIQRDKPTPEQIDKRVEEIRKSLGMATTKTN